MRNLINEFEFIIIIELGWRKEKDGYRKRVAGLVEKANKTVPSHIKIPHPDTDPVERQRQVEKMKLLDTPMDLDDYGYGDIGDDDDDYGDEDDDDDDDGVDVDDDDGEPADDDGEED